MISPLNGAKSVLGVFRQLSDQLHWLWKALAVLWIAAIAAAYHFGVRSFHIPAESMLPTLKVGDVVWCTGFAPGTNWAESWPLFNSSGYARLVDHKLRRGDLAIFKLPRDERTEYVKRIVGLPGDRVRMLKGVLHINGIATSHAKVEDYVDYDRTGNFRRFRQIQETLPNGVTYRTLDLVSNGELDDTLEYVVPRGHYFALGDNRDNSVDSRLPAASLGVGFVPSANFVCRPRVVQYSISGRSRLGKWWIPTSFRTGRFFQVLQ